MAVSAFVVAEAGFAVTVVVHLWSCQTGARVATERRYYDYTDERVYFYLYFYFWNVILSFCSIFCFIFILAFTFFSYLNSSFVRRLLEMVCQ